MQLTPKKATSWHPASTRSSGRHTVEPRTPERAQSLPIQHAHHTWPEWHATIAWAGRGRDESCMRANTVERDTLYANVLEWQPPLPEYLSVTDWSRPSLRWHFIAIAGSQPMDTVRRCSTAGACRARPTPVGEGPARCGDDGRRESMGAGQKSWRGTRLPSTGSPVGASELAGRWAPRAPPRGASAYLNPNRHRRSGRPWGRRWPFRGALRTVRLPDFTRRPELGRRFAIQSNTPTAALRRGRPRGYGRVPVRYDTPPTVSMPGSWVTCSAPHDHPGGLSPVPHMECERRVPEGTAPRHPHRFERSDQKKPLRVPGHTRPAGLGLLGSDRASSLCSRRPIPESL
ncbi:hypothetical protein FQA39_LY19405 [Lamprigera yunnana]|nr:hypothetical protein FQA39_LY19405 [Lamprigera yunnana]